MSRKIKISGLADAVMEELNAYAKTTTEGMKQAVAKAATTTKKRNQGACAKEARRLSKKLDAKENLRVLPCPAGDGLLS